MISPLKEWDELHFLLKILSNISSHQIQNLWPSLPHNHIKTTKQLKNPWKSTSKTITTGKLDTLLSALLYNVVTDICSLGIIFCTHALPSHPITGCRPNSTCAEFFPATLSWKQWFWVWTQTGLKLLQTENFKFSLDW